MGNDHRACSCARVLHVRNVLQRTFCTDPEEGDLKANRWKIITHRTTKRPGRVFPPGLLEDSFVRLLLRKNLDVVEWFFPEHQISRRLDRAL